VVPGITHYDRLAGAIDWLQATGLILKIPIVNTGHLPFKGYSKESLFKLLLFDVGMLGHMSGIPPKTLLAADYGSYKGYFAENFVAQELIGAGHSNLVSWQEPPSELEFLTECDGDVIPIEVKSGHSIKTKSLTSFLKKYRPPYAALFSGQALKAHPQESIKHYPLYLAGRFPLN
jgi:predicted AAA+ superfamily ATPase